MKKIQGNSNLGNDVELQQHLNLVTTPLFGRIACFIKNQLT
jgi:hypothetical protein